MIILRQQQSPVATWLCDCDYNCNHFAGQQWQWQRNEKNYYDDLVCDLQCLRRRRRRSTEQEAKSQLYLSAPVPSILLGHLWVSSLFFFFLIFFLFFPLLLRVSNTSANTHTQKQRNRNTGNENAMRRFCGARRADSRRSGCLAIGGDMRRCGYLRASCLRSLSVYLPGSSLTYKPTRRKIVVGVYQRHWCTGKTASSMGFGRIPC